MKELDFSKSIFIITILLLLILHHFEYYSNQGGFVLGAGVVRTLVGSMRGLDKVLATQTSLNLPSSITHEDANGEYYISESYMGVIWRVFNNGTMVRFAGTGFQGYNGDGKLALETDLNYPGSLMMYDGELYFSDLSNYLVRKVDRNGYVRTVAGSIKSYGYADNVLANETNIYPTGIYVTKLGEVLIADSSIHRIRKVLNNGTIITIAGNGKQGYNGEGLSGLDSALKEPYSVDMDSDGNIYFADKGNSIIRKILASNGAVITVAGNGTKGYFANTIDALSSQLDTPVMVTVGKNGEFYIVTGNLIRKVSSDGLISTVVGTGATGPFEDNILAVNATLGIPSDVKISRNSELLIVDTFNYRIRKVLLNGTIQTIAGNGFDRFNGDGLQAKDTLLNSPSSLIVNPDQSLYIVERDNQRIRKVDPNGIVSTFIGTGKRGFNGDRLALDVQLYNPTSISIDSNGTIWFSEANSHRIRKLLSNGTVITVVGSTTGSTADGPALQTKLTIPNGIGFDLDGSLLIADRYNHRIRKLLSNGTLITIAGTGVSGKGGDDILATNSSLNQPSGVCTMPNGDILIADRANHQIRRLFVNGTIKTIAGTGSSGYNGDGLPATSSTLNYPQTVTMFHNEIYMVDTSNSRIRKILNNGTMITIVGNGIRGDSLDGLDPLESKLKSPYHVTFDSRGRMYISDYSNHKIKVVDFNSSPETNTTFNNRTLPSTDSNTTSAISNSTLNNNSTNLYNSTVIGNNSLPNNGSLIPSTSNSTIVTPTSNHSFTSIPIRNSTFVSQSQKSCIPTKWLVLLLFVAFLLTTNPQDYDNKNVE
ncbi:predicted protein [Naegleria gruberi]|uniref:Predicted protein n=1 Tax=Naegleria gruberi TaxID=5762 RepID=D2VIQ6_NAEGR|nr:uncharacterized protein NAEGRDRAFT_68760 [Naegleria gruberi]EFC43317.1 predicted protein [Naegleria gruberi]|eukprot:XP_002676061.1 predicted protein [Naegleria gruberi strain NEG-M]